MFNPFAVVAGVGLEIRIPLNFFGKDHLAINERGAFTVGATEVKADATTLKVTTERQVRCAGYGQSIDGSSGKSQRLFEKLLKEISIKRPGSGRGVNVLQGLGESGGMGTARRHGLTKSAHATPGNHDLTTVLAR